MNKSASTPDGSTFHEVVRAEISRRIATGIYKPGDVITSIARLSKEFGVSAITVKRALRDLQSAGLLTSIPGKGTYVKDRFRFICELDACMSALDSARRLGFQPKMELVSLTKERIKDTTLSAFNPPDKVLLCVRKVIYADDVPIMYDSSFLPTDMSDEIVDEFGERFIIDALRRHDVTVKHMSLVIDAAPASPEAQQVFSVPNGYPTLRRLYNLKTDSPTMSVIGVVESPFDQLACSVGFGGWQISKMDQGK
ncbi:MULTISPECIES: GntR family transcriptional regulator [Paraburkholderia]|uniref:GntR family transcriptional regulator n=1 Tax=Paraburkholderia dipogonis TaxID=1211383 RepID=A0A4Y8MGK4_9BURK|nr:MULTISPECIES: GntR family transcriptional regulator [Paraburkholderia]RKR31498.1 DNA-binding GntR family transcriptional regulator [Paraburkholderia sp. BL17N1]TFE36571.1 GntR family transcriptional regulator [Paraburkholderia dipogonis]